MHNNILFEPDAPVIDDVEPGEYVQITVEDTGTGMAANIMQRIFEPFFTTKEAGKGTGMGLAVVFGIVKRMGGTVSVESEAGQGSTFRVFLPIAHIEEKMESPEEIPIAGGSESILFIDDEELIVEWGKTSLERLGYKVTALLDTASHHVQLTVNDFDACRAFYSKLFAWLEMRVIFDSPQFFYGVGSRTGIAICPASEEFRGERFEQRRIGLHQLCLRARRREDIDEMHEFLKSIGARIVHPPEEARWAPGYYSVLFEDPDGLRLEANFVPGKGNLASDAVPTLDVERVARGS